MQAPCSAGLGCVELFGNTTRGEGPRGQTEEWWICLASAFLPKSCVVDSKSLIHRYCHWLPLVLESTFGFSAGNRGATRLGLVKQKRSPPTLGDVQRFSGSHSGENGLVSHFGFHWHFPGN